MNRVKLLTQTVHCSRNPLHCRERQPAMCPFIFICSPQSHCVPLINAPLTLKISVERQKYVIFIVKNNQQSHFDRHFGLLTVLAEFLTWTKASKSAFNKNDLSLLFIKQTNVFVESEKQLFYFTVLALRVCGVSARIYIDMFMFAFMYHWSCHPVRLRHHLL